MIATPAARGGLANAPAATAGGLRVLIVEDNPGDAEILTETLDEATSSGPAFTHRCVARLADVPAVLASWAPDVVLLDLSLPDGRGLGTVEAMRAMAPEVPVVVMTGLADDAIALRAVQAGAQDYLLKGRDVGETIRRAVRYAVERERLVREARRATAMRDEALAVVSHDLRNPLGAISMCAQALLGAESAASDDARRLSETIQRSCDWMQRLISDLLDVARLDAGTLALVEESMPPGALIDALEQVFRPLANGQQVTLVVASAVALPTIAADADRLVQALGNLLGNALKFTEAGGRVVLAAERADAGPKGEPSGLRLVVSDTGRGIQPEDIGRIFDRFWQPRSTRRGGAGLGLAIAKGIVEAHGGTIGVESAPGVGTTFTILLPALPDT